MQFGKNEPEVDIDDLKTMETNATPVSEIPTRKTAKKSKTEVTEEIIKPKRKKKTDIEE